MNSLAWSHVFLNFTLKCPGILPCKITFLYVYNISLILAKRLRSAMCIKSSKQLLLSGMGKIMSHRYYRIRAINVST